ncbi:HORMA domain-containing protein 1 isoform X2 [Thalassophryne amazonica]|uniref:HORMA domain-containing protein 1 isoform X2 n=1 Tax=Thalassophryne amazonica TaxID=390379 RepID=UPI0014714EF4|nr:HORMA domain-containing protein 1 isoform X2 [Thalassophryne amazonica]
MACMQRARTSQDTQILPSQVASEQQSLVVIKKLLAIAVSGITYLRGLFPETAYGSKYVEDQKVMILREAHLCPAASQIVQWMQGCFDAIQKKYLRTVILSIYTDPDNPEKVTEFYQFKIQYTTKGPQMDFESNNNNTVTAMSFGNTKKASILLVRKLYTLMQNLGPLPDNVWLNMKLAYYDDVTPQEYQPPGFKEANCGTMEFEKEPVKLTMGEVVTPFHTLKLDMATERQRLEQMEEEGVLLQSQVIEDMEKSDNDSTVLKNNDEENQMNCQVEKMESCEEFTEVDTLVKKTCDMEVGLKRSRSGRILRSTRETQINVNKETSVKAKMISQYEIPNSQEMPATSIPRKRKFSEPKECN